MDLCRKSAHVPAMCRRPNLGRSPPQGSLEGARWLLAHPGAHWRGAPSKDTPPIVGKMRLYRKPQFFGEGIHPLLPYAEPPPPPPSLESDTLRLQRTPPIVGGLSAQTLLQRTPGLLIPPQSLERRISRGGARREFVFGGRPPLGPAEAGPRARLGMAATKKHV